MVADYQRKSPKYEGCSKFRDAQRSNFASSEGFEPGLKFTREDKTIRPHPQRGLGSISHLGYVFLSCLFLFSPLAQIASQAQTSMGQVEATPDSSRKQPIST